MNNWMAIHNPLEKLQKQATAISASEYETRSGRGLMPRWLSALIAQGQASEDFSIRG